MSQDPVVQKKRRSRAIQVAVLVPNIILLGIVVAYLAGTRLGERTVEPLVSADPETAQRIGALEEAVRRGGGGSAAIELARLYRKAGELPWAYDALRAAERRAGDDPTWRMRLGLAYIEIGKNDDGLRLLRETLERCHARRCRADLEARLAIFTRVAELFVERRIDARKDHDKVAAIFKEVVKPARAVPAPPAGEGATPPATRPAARP